MERAIFVALALGCALAGCGKRDDDSQSNKARPANGANAGPRRADYVAKIREMAPPLRKATFLRAVRDAQQSCQDVIAEQETKSVNGQASWIVQCEDGSGFVIAVERDGNAKVMNALKPTPTQR